MEKNDMVTLARNAAETKMSHDLFEHRKPYIMRTSLHFFIKLINTTHASKVPHRSICHYGR